jgi:hypothetical protein
MIPTWENKVITYKLKWKGFDYGTMEADLNQLGREGWEVVQTVIPSVGAGQSLEVALILKRPRSGV